MKKVYVKDDKAVSPIIATILLVAITVVLAATLYTILGGYTTFLGASTPQASITVTNATSSHSSTNLPKPIYFVYINQFGGNISLNDVQMIIVTSGNNVGYATLGSYHNTSKDLNINTSAGWNVSVKGPDYLSGSTVITLQGIGSNDSNYSSEYIVHVRLVDMVTNGEIGSYTL